MTALNALHAENKKEMLALYEERIGAKDFKTAMAIRLKIAELDAIYLGKPAVEVEPPPESFATQQAIVKHLVDLGWKSNDSTLSLHIQQRKLIPQADGTFSREDVESYAAANLVNNPQRSERQDADDLSIKIKEEELRRQKNKNDKEEGRLIDAEDVRRELENMLVTFRSRILIIPRKLSGQLSQMSDAHKVEEVLTRELRDTLTTLSQYHPEAMEQRAAE